MNFITCYNYYASTIRIEPKMQAAAEARITAKVATMPATRKAKVSRVVCVGKDIIPQDAEEVCVMYEIFIFR